MAFLAVCGALSYFLFAARNARDFPAGIPFGLLAAYLFVRSWKLWIIAVVLIDLVWIASERAAVFSIADHNADYYPAWPVRACWAAWELRRPPGWAAALCSPSDPWLGRAEPGALSALPFGWWVQTNLDEPRSAFAGVACFAIWQAVVGTTLWARSSTIRDLPDTAPGR